MLGRCRATERETKRETERERKRERASHAVDKRKEEIEMYRQDE